MKGGMEGSASRIQRGSGNWEWGSGIAWQYGSRACLCVFKKRWNEPLRQPWSFRGKNSMHQWSSSITQNGHNDLFQVSNLLFKFLFTLCTIVFISSYLISVICYFIVNNNNICFQFTGRNWTHTFIFCWMCLRVSAVPMSPSSWIQTTSSFILTSFIFKSVLIILWTSLVVITITSENTKAKYSQYIPLQQTLTHFKT